MSDEALFADISPLEEILEKFFTDNDPASNWIPNQSLIELPSEKEDEENTLLQSGATKFWLQWVGHGQHASKPATSARIQPTYLRRRVNEVDSTGSEPKVKMSAESRGADA